MPSPNQKPELLAPAGTIDAALAALDAGADAIYAGLPRFNARVRGQNCTTEELSKLRAYTRRLDRKLFVTLNTLIKQSELPDIAQVLSELMSIRPDAVIVQDLGVLHLIRNHFPELTVHASTQMGIHNSAGVRMAESMGIKRVILERQVTYEEIESIRKQTSVELEVFIHGALCCARSGSCLFSSWMGGWSGNRGRCKQPCRRRYFSDSGNGFFFSPKDLYSLEDIPRLASMGISSLKIEGRLKRADYVRHVVEAYRLVLDTAPEDLPSVLPEAKRILAGALGRKWTPPFRSQADFGDTIQHRSMGTAGRLIGTVSESKSTGFAARLTATLRLHDTIRIQPPSGDEGPGLTVTRMTVNQRDSHKGAAGQTCWIAFDKPVATGSRIFKIGTKSTSPQKRLEKLQAAGVAVDVRLSVSASHIRAELPAVGKQWEGPLDAQPARQHALTNTTVEAEFAKTGDSDIAAGEVIASVDGDLFVPSSQLKALRRSFWKWFADSIGVDTVQAAYAERPARISFDSPPPPDTATTAETTVLVGDSKTAPIQNAIISRRIDSMKPDTDEVVLPEFCAEGDLPGLRDQIESAIQRGIRRFRIRSLYGLDLLRNTRDLKVTASYPLPVCNSAAFRELEQHGVERATAWVELEESTVRDLLEHIGKAGEVLRYARLPLLVTRMQIPTVGDIQDARGARFSVRSDGELTILLPEKVFAIDPPGGAHCFIDLTHAEWDEPSTSSFNYPRELA
jgi:putative protease